MKTEQMKEIHSINNDIFDQFSKEVDLINATRKAWIHALTSGKPFDMTDPCRVCRKTGHTFKDCKPLKNVTFLQRHLTNSQMNAAQNQKMIGEAMANQSCKGINQLMNAAAAVDTEEEEQEMAFDDDTTEVTNNTDPDFH